jgi:membrane protein EpsK
VSRPGPQDSTAQEPRGGMHPNLSSRQFVKNLTANLCGLVLGILSGLILTPYWIRSFGVAAYGLVPLTNNVIAYLGVFTVVLSASVGRFITVEIGRKNFDQANRVFNTSLIASLLLAIAVCGVGAVAAARVDVLLAIPAGLERDSQWMILIATGTFVLSLVQAPFAVAQFAANRIDVSAWLAIAMRAVQIAVALILVSTVYRRPGALMVGYMAGALVSVGAAIHYWRRLMPWSRLGWALDTAILREQIGFGIWSVINQVGSLLYLQIDLLVINRLLGPVAGGQYAALSQWSLLVRSLGSTVSTVFGPSIVHLYAAGDVPGVVGYARWAIRLTGMFLAPVIGIICGLGQPLLVVWLGPEYAKLSWVLVVMILHLCVNIAVYPLFAVQSAVNRVKVPAIVTCVMGAANAVLALFLTPECGMLGVATAGAVMMTAKNVLFTPLYAAKCLDAPPNVFFREIIKILSLTSVLAAIGFTGSRYVYLATWPRLAGAGSVLVIVYLAVVWFALLAPGERKQVCERLRSMRLVPEGG